VIGMAYLAVWSTTVVVLDGVRDRSYGDRHGMLGYVVSYDSGLVPDGWPCGYWDMSYGAMVLHAWYGQHSSMVSIVVWSA
jgi:hypothetical protein